jgi:hypothetical protein
MIQRGFMDGYSCWTKHDEEPAMLAEAKVVVRGQTFLLIMRWDTLKMM